LLLLLWAPDLSGETALPAPKEPANTQGSGDASLTTERPPETAPSIVSGPSESALKESDQPGFEASRAISQYTESIRQLEVEQGAYSPALSEQLIGLGDAYSKLGNHEQALHAYQRAFLISRSQQGLHDMGQTPFLERVIEAQKALGRDEGLDNSHDYLLWLNRRNYDSGDPKLLPALIRVASWKLEAFARDPGESSVDHIFEAKALFEQALDIVEASPDMDDQVAIDYLYDIAQQNFNAGFFVDSYKIGRAALQKIIALHEKNQALPRTSLAEAWALLGDWELSFNKSGSAAESYRNAYRVLGGGGSRPEFVNRLFGKPRSLTLLDVPTKPTPYEQIILSGRENSSSSQSDDESGAVHINQLIDENTEFVLAEFDVSASGRVRDLEIIKISPEDDVSFRRNARERILRVPFRPRLENGELVHTEDFVMLYRFR